MKPFFIKLSSFCYCPLLKERLMASNVVEYKGIISFFCLSRFWGLEVLSRRWFQSPNPVSYGLLLLISGLATREGAKPSNSVFPIKKNPKHLFPLSLKPNTIYGYHLMERIIKKIGLTNLQFKEYWRPSGNQAGKKLPFSV